MSEMNHGFFARLAQKLPNFKKQIGEQLQKRKLSQNGASKTPICQVCGAKFSIKTTLALGAPIPKYCAACNELLDSGCGAFVTLEQPARFWIGLGVKPEFAGKVAVISTEQMDTIQRADKAKALKAQETQNGEAPA